jgi:hypothetical protein
MEPFIPFFPLNLVVYPNENLNLHIFEPRYRQLVNECLETGKTFGIPAFINNKLPGLGTEVQIVELSKRYEDGQMDIKTKALRVFKILTFENPVIGKLYSGGKIAYQNTVESEFGVIPQLMTQLELLQILLQSKIKFDTYQPFFSYQIAHKIGLLIDDEYNLLSISNETERQRLILRHLNKVIPVMTEMERTKERIKLNGHFKNLDPLNL